MSRKPYRRVVSRSSWWLARPRYVRYMARETSSIFIGAYSGLIVVGLFRLSNGAASWNAFLNTLQRPVSVAFHVIALAFAIYHTTTWFNVTPKAMPVQIGATRLPGGVIVGAHYAGWAVVSVLILYLVGR